MTIGIATPARSSVPGTATPRDRQEYPARPRPRRIGPAAPMSAGACGADWPRCSAGWSTSQAGPGKNAGWPAAPRLKAGRGQTWYDAKSRPWRPGQPGMFIPIC